MEPNILKYTNGRGHLAMSIVCMAVGLCLVLFGPDASTKGIGTTIILTVFGAWFIPGAARQVVHEVVNQLPAAAASVSAPAQTVDPDATNPRLPAVAKP